MTRMIHEETNPKTARRLVQQHGREAVVVNPPAWPLSPEEIDHVYGLPFTRRPHPSYGRAANSGFRGGEGLDPDHARLFRRLRVLLDHHP